MATAREQYIRDRIMYQITVNNTSDQRPSNQMRFGFFGMKEAFSSPVTDMELAEAVRWLIDANHLRMLGAYVFGVGNGEGLTPYDLSRFDITSKMPAAALKDDSISADAYQTKTPAKKPAVIQPLPPIQTIDDTPKVDEVGNDVTDAINKLKDRLQTTGPNITQIEMKIDVLTQLIPIDPVIGSVLTKIRADYSALLEMQR